MRLRTRFFLISWPIVVLAIAAVAFGVERWTIVELERIERSRSGPAAARDPARDPVRDRARDARWADSIARWWSVEGAPPDAARLRALGATVAAAPQLALLDSSGALRVASHASLTLSKRPSVVGGIAHFDVRATRGGDGAASAEFALDGIPLRGSRGALLGALYTLPSPERLVEPLSPAARANALRRRIWYVAAAASLAAALASLLLAGPLVRRVRRLGDAAGAIRGGALDTRIDDARGDELGALAGSFNAMAESLARSRDTQRKLIGDVAHELRTPLTNVVGLVEAMQDGLRPADAATLSTLRGEVGLLTSLVHELQELSLAEAGQLRLDIGRVDASLVVRDAIEALGASAGERRVEAHGITDPVVVLADRQRLAQILRNLLSNAIAHTAERGRVSVELARERSGSVRITVEDDGRGIPAEHLALVFDRFHRVDPSRARASGGMGLGLALVRELTHAMHGRVSVQSTEGEGSRFTVELPAGA